MRVTPIAMADPPLRSSYGRHQPYALRTIVELVSEDGIVGAAEAHGSALAINDFLRARASVVGRSAYDLARIRTDLEQAFTPVSAAVGAGSASKPSTAWSVSR